MQQNKFYLSFGRHERYGYDTAIERIDMIAAYLSGIHLKECLPLCSTVYHSPLPRAVETARFQALGMGCMHLIETSELEESVPTFTIRRFVNRILQNTDSNTSYYHFVTHLPVIEKLGLPILGTGDICLLAADNLEEMLKENFSLRVIAKPKVSPDILHELGVTAECLNAMTSDDIHALLLSAKNA